MERILVKMVEVLLRLADRAEEIDARQTRQRGETPVPVLTSMELRARDAIRLGRVRIGMLKVRR
jgi:hypothetical protein